MNSKSNKLVGAQTLEQFRSPNSRNAQKLKKHIREVATQKSDIELALAVILVDVASCDGAFDQAEYQIISCSLRQILGTCRTDVKKLVNQANLALSNLRGVSRYAQILCDNLSDDERKYILKAVEHIIHADGVEDGFETYMRHKLSDLLDVPLESQEEAAAQ